MCGSNLEKKSLSGPEAVTEKIVKAVVGAVPDDPGVERFDRLSRVREGSQRVHNTLFIGKL
jgi:hypothetical protein